MQVFLNLLSKVVPGLFESVAVDYRDISRPQITICVFNQKNLLLLLFFIKAHSRLLLNSLVDLRSEEHTSELQSLMRISYAVFCLKKKINTQLHTCNIIFTPILQDYNLYSQFLTTS